MPMTMTLTLTLAGVTYGELFEFVDAARAAGVDPGQAVRCLGSDERGDRFELDVAATALAPGAAARAAASVARTEAGGGPDGGATTPAPATAGALPDALKSLVRSDEDLERVIATLRDLRRFLG